MATSSKKRYREPDLLDIEDFIEQQLSEYIKIHKRHEKEINYIG